ncbi:MAG: radical SAM protein [Deltaproteobacteria bacterium]|nr:radical SAM protein [Deltaproteobacteria bacterium]
MANLGYLQVVRHCNHFCGFCSNPTTPYVHTFETMKVLVDDFVDRGYFGIILTGGEPTLHPELPRITGYARERGLHVRMITNGHKLADPDFARELAEAGLQHAHVSIYSVRPEVEDRLRGIPNTLNRAFQALDNAHANGITVNINCVINKQNADHLDENIEYFIEHHPYIPHFVWNNLDPSMGRAEVNQDEYMHRLRDCEASLHRACRLLHASGRTFRVEKMPLCYLTEFAWASTETRKIVKGEERIVHFLDAKQTVRQTRWGHMYAEACNVCSLRTICGGMFDRGDGYDPAELYPVFVDRDRIVSQIIYDGTDPSYAHRTMDQWRAEFDARLAEQEQAVRAEAAAGDEAPIRDGEPEAEADRRLSIGMVNEDGLRLFEKKRRAEGRMAERKGIRLENTEVALGPDAPAGTH